MEGGVSRAGVKCGHKSIYVSEDLAQNTLTSNNLVAPYVYSIISRRGVIYNNRSDVISLSTGVYVCNID